MNITILLSGSGTNFQAIVQAIQTKRIRNCTILKVIADRECEGINRAIDAGIDFEVISKPLLDFNDRLTKSIPVETDYVVLAGFLSILPLELIKQFPERILNIHPSLLPNYGGKGMYGHRVHEAVIKAKDSESGCSVHLVDEGVDTGQVVFQRKVKVVPTDTAQSLQQRVLIQEHQVYPIAIDYFSLLHSCHFPNAPLLPGGQYSQDLIDKGLKTYYSACHFIKNLPYQKNTDYHGDFVVKEMKGSCSTKHNFLKRLADELQLSGIRMMLGVFKMNGDTTPKVAEVLAKYNLPFIPEAHTYFRCQDEVLDFTFSESFEFNFGQNIVIEEEYEADQIGEWKDNYHRQILEEYKEEHNLPYSVDELWAIRQECVEALFSNEFSE